MALEDIVSKVREFFFEDQKEKKSNEEALQAELEGIETEIQPEKADEPVMVVETQQVEEPKKTEVEKKIIEVVEEQQKEVKSETVIKATANKSVFLNVTGNDTKVEPKQLVKEKVAKETTNDKKDAYRMANVISPIFGTQNSNSLNFVSRPVREDSEVRVAKSYIGTVLSPINGNNLYEEVEQEDEVDDKIAAMQTNDFIDTVEFKEPEAFNDEEVIDAKFVTDKVPVIRPVIVVPHLQNDNINKKSQINVPVIQPVVSTFKEEDIDEQQMSLFE